MPSSSVNGIALDRLISSVTLSNSMLIQLLVILFSVSCSLKIIHKA